MWNQSQFIDALRRFLILVASLPIYIGVIACIIGTIKLLSARWKDDATRRDAYRYLTGGILVLVLGIALAMPAAAVSIGKLIQGN